jgi:hypothetical protein
MALFHKREREVRWKFFISSLLNHFYHQLGKVKKQEQHCTRNSSIRFRRQKHNPQFLIRHDSCWFSILKMQNVSESYDKLTSQYTNTVNSVSILWMAMEWKFSLHSRKYKIMESYPSVCLRKVFVLSNCRGILWAHL